MPWQIRSPFAPRPVLASREDSMGTIVEYTDQKPPRNEYPKRIISPTRALPICFTDMEEIGTAQREERWIFQYRRCRECGFTVRLVLREIPDTALLAGLRRALQNSLMRNSPEL